MANDSLLLITILAYLNVDSVSGSQNGLASSRTYNALLETCFLMAELPDGTNSIKTAGALFTIFFVSFLSNFDEFELRGKKPLL